jgi:hypothetical protein
MLPQELKAMSQQQQVCVYENLKHPVKCKKIRYFEDKFFTDRLLPAVKIEPVQWETRTAPALPPAAVPLAQATEHNAAGAAIHDDQEHDEMKWSQVAAAAALTAGMVSGCASPSGKPEYKHNPNPKERYEITMTIQEAPGAFEGIVGSMQYLVPDDSCVPESDPINGIRKNPKEWVRYPVEKVSDNQYRAVVWADGMVDENYYGLGVCKWEFMQATISLKGKSVRFMPWLKLQELRSQQPKTLYFSRRTYFAEKGFPDYGDVDRSRFGAEVQDELFAITLTSRRLTP